MHGFDFRLPCGEIYFACDYFKAVNGRILSMYLRMSKPHYKTYYGDGTEQIRTHCGLIVPTQSPSAASQRKPDAKRL